MTSLEASVAPRAGPRTVSVAALAWTAAVALFLGIRVGVALGSPVGGAELVHLSGAWQAHLGIDDDRFVPTLFQALSALLFHAGDSELPARVVALAATATIPAALHLLRPRLGEGGAIVAMVLLALDAPGAVIGATASANAFDLAVAAWLAVLVLRMPSIGVAWVAVGFIVATSGSIVLPLLVAVAMAWRPGQRPSVSPAPWFAAAGGIAGILLASFRFGLGWDGLRVPPFQSFIAGFDGRWSTAEGWEVLVIYSAPAVAVGALAIAQDAWRRWLARRPTVPGLVSAWSAVAGAWMVAAAGAHSFDALAALDLPLALAAGPAVAWAIGTMSRADWRVARWVLGGVALLAALSLAHVLDWAEAERVGNGGQQFQVAFFGLAAIALLGVLALRRATAPALVVPALLVLFAPLAAGAFSVAIGTLDEPVSSPVSDQQGRELRAVAMKERDERGGTIVIYQRLEQDATWSFRDSGVVTFATRPTDGAAVLVWPADLPPPEGFEALAGNFAFTREVLPPTESVLKYLHWFTDRSTLENSARPVTVYLRTQE